MTFGRTGKNSWPRDMSGDEMAPRTMIAMNDEAVHRIALRKGMLEGLAGTDLKADRLKKSLAGGISNPRIDKAYAAARRAGATGGKILGAGGGGFLLLFCPPAKRGDVVSALRGWREIPFHFEPEGSKIIYVSK